jgi:hypothetical protein
MKKWVVLACAVIAIAALGLTFFRSSDEERVRKTLETLAQIVAVQEGDTILSRTARLRSRMKEVVDDDVRVNVADLSMDVRGRHKLEEDGVKVGLLYSSATVDFSNLSIKIDPQGTVATVDAAARVTATVGGERKTDKRDVHFLLHKDGDWKITTIDVAPNKESAN